MGEARRNESSFSLDLLSVVIVVLACATALVHFLVALSLRPPGAIPFPLLFYFNAFGYLVLVIALCTPALSSFQRAIRWMLIAYAALTFALWFVLAAHRTPEGWEIACS